MLNEELIEIAKRARENAYAPYSKFLVGAALLSADGQVFTGCNIENSSYGLTMCAERTAVFKAVSEGARQFTRIAVVADTDILTPPCGACRQVLWDFSHDLEVVLGNLNGKIEIHQMRDLYPRAFDSEFFAPEVSTD